MIQTPNSGNVWMAKFASKPCQGQSHRPLCSFSLSLPFPLLAFKDDIDAQNGCGGGQSGVGLADIVFIPYFSLVHEISSLRSQLTGERSIPRH